MPMPSKSNPPAAAPLDPREGAAPSSATTILGHAVSLHDAALAIIEGDYVYAEGIERHLQCKSAHGFTGFDYSARPVRAALKLAGVKLTRDLTVRTTWPYREKQFDPPPEIPEGHFREWYEASLVTDYARQASERRFVEELAQSVDDFQRLSMGNHLGLRSIEVKHTPHHLCHAATAVYTSPFEECVVMVADGTGEDDSLTFFHFANGEFRRLAHTPTFSASLGNVYAVVTQLCGFSFKEGEEWKVMGLAGYGEFDQRIYDFFRARTEVRGLDIAMRLHEMDDSWVAELSEIVGGFRHPRDPDIVGRSGALARSFQQFFEDVVCELAANAYKLGLSENLAYAGGLALNSSANGKIAKRSGFRRVHVPSAPADDGNALGAALYEKHVVRREPYSPRVMSPYLGSTMPESEVAKIVSFGAVEHRLASSDEELWDIASDLLAAGNVIAWCQGRAEFGPRALGNRSILADARDPGMKDKLNARVKFREEYRPVAPSILHEYGDEYFEDYELEPYMARTLPFREAVKSRVPAAVHLDGTGRLQSVTRELNPLYWGLIDTFRKKTGVPLLINTSFNVMGKPIVHSVADALTVLYTTGLDALVIGRYVLQKR